MKLRVNFALFAWLTLTSSLANAQLSEGERKAAARAAYSEGVALQDKGNPAEALARFEAAEKLFDAPTHLLHIAECQALTGKLVEAVETYETLSRKSYGKDAPEVFLQAQDQGRAELAQLRPRVPTMRVLVKPDAQMLPNLQIAINDKQLPAELVGIARPVNPGSYRLSASANGWGTPTPTDVEVHEKDTSSVTLTLQKGVVAAAAPLPPATGTSSTASTAPTASTGTTASPPPYDQGTKPVTTSTGPSPFGLLLGIRPAYFVPVGSVVAGTKFSDIASAGPGIGIDFIGRVAKMLLVGGTVEIASLGAPNADRFPSGSKVDVSNTSVYLGVLGGIMPNVDRVTFVGDVGLGMRWLAHSQTDTATSNKIEGNFSGLELTLKAGLSIPAGPIRIVPNVGLAFGSFTNKDCTVNGDLMSNCTTSTTDSASNITSTTGHTILTAGLGLYYHLDLGKKAPPKATAAR